MQRRLISEYTAGRSSSVPVETAQELLHSLCFTLRIDPENRNLHPKTVRMLLQNDPEQMLAQGRKCIQRQLKLAQQLALRLHLQLPGAAEYLRQTALRLLPRIQVALRHQTLNGIFVPFKTDTAS